MPSYSFDLALGIEQIAADMNDMKEFPTLMAFKESISDKKLKTMLNVYPLLCTIAKRSLQIGNIRRAEKYYAMLKRISKEIKEGKDICIKALETKLINDLGD